jgi:hypothetical protein
MQRINEPGIMSSAYANSSAYTQSQVLCGLREMWERVVGTEAHFDAETPIVAFMRADDSWDDFDLADIFDGFEDFFGFTCPRQQWRELFGFELAQRSRDEYTAGFLSVVVIVGAAIAATYGASSLWFVAGLVVAASIYATANLWQRFTNPLPDGIISFRDLAITIAEARQPVTAK